MATSTSASSTTGQRGDHERAPRCPGTGRRCGTSPPRARPARGGSAASVRPACRARSGSGRARCPRVSPRSAPATARRAGRAAWRTSAPRSSSRARRRAGARASGQRGAQDRVPRLGADEHRGAHEREGHEHPDRRGGHEGAADRLDADPLERQQREPDARGGARAPSTRLAARASRRRPAAGRLGSSDGRRCGPTLGPGSAGARRGAARRARRGPRARAGRAPPRRRIDLARHLRPREALGALARGL